MLTIVLALLIVFLTMIVEAGISSRHEQVLRRRGAIEPADDAYNVMRFAYPGCFFAMALEGMLRDPADSRPALTLGLTIWGIAKALKWWAMTSLGSRWSFRVLVLPDDPLVSSGPYRYLRHPNYLAVCGELIGVAIVLRAMIAGAAAVVGFGSLMLWRLRIEERALARRRRS